MKTWLTIITLLFTAAIPSKSQNYLHMDKDKIMLHMKNEQKAFKLLKEVDGTRKFLKYGDKDKERTLLFLLGKNGTCQAIKLMGDYKYKQAIVDSLQRNCEAKKENTWECQQERTKCSTYTLKDKEWYFELLIQNCKKE